VRVTAVVVCWNAAPALRTCLAALDAQDHDDLEIVVVDNASTDGSREILREELQRPRRHPLRVRFNTTNRGFAGAVNDAVAEAADAEAVLVANVDIEPEPDLCSRLVAVLRQDPLVGSVQPLLLRTVPGPDGRDVIDTTGHVATRARLFRNRGEGETDADRYPRGEVFGVSGALALHRRAMLEDIAWRGPGRRARVPHRGPLRLLRRRGAGLAGASAGLACRLRAERPSGATSAGAPGPAAPHRSRR
jgi:GT2 family glycosyltransferase